MTPDQIHAVKPLTPLAGLALYVLGVVVFWAVLKARARPDPHDAQAEAEDDARAARRERWLLGKDPDPELVQAFGSAEDSGHSGGY